jgi:anti-sigma B factor antagonist
VRRQPPDRPPRLIEQGELKIRLEDEPQAAFISLYGALDLGTAEVLDSTIRSVESRTAKTIILDLSGLSFIDSTGITVLIRAATRSPSDINGLALLRGPEPVQRLFKLTGLEEHLPFAD